MATQADLTAKIEELNAKIAEVNIEVPAAFSRLEGLIGAPPVDTQPLIDKMTEGQVILQSVIDLAKTKGV